MPRLRTSVGAAAVLIAASLPLLSANPATAAGPGYLQWDFDKNGHADLAVGAAGESVGNATGAGKVSIFMASDSGTYHDAKDLTQDMLGGAAEGNVNDGGDQFGWAMTSGDYDGDGYADLAVAANREDYGSGASTLKDVGIVTVIWGGPDGLTPTGAVNLRFNVNGVETANSFAGDALASGDMNGDDSDDLAVGAPGVELVKVYNGVDGAANRASFGAASTSLSEYNLPGDKHFGDLFGETLAMGDFDRDNLADLVIGAPYDADDRNYSVGAIVEVPGSAGGPDIAGAKRWSPDTAGISSAPHTFTVNDDPDSFGRTLGVGDLDGDGTDDLAVGIPGSTVGSVQDAGAVNILYGALGTGLTDRDLLLTANSTGIAGPTGTRNLFGASLDTGGASGAKDLLAIGSAKEVVWVLKGDSGTDSQTFSQDTDGVFGARETGDAFGAFVRFLDTKGDGNEYLAVGSPGESYNTGEASAGVVYVLPSTGAMPTGASSMKFEEDDPGVEGSRESGDFFGFLGDSH